MGRWQDWQVRQAEQALRIYFVNFLNRADWRRQPGSAVVDKDGRTTPLAALQVLRDRIRTRHYSYRTECSYVDWTRRFFDYLTHRLRDHAPKTVNNVLTVLSVLLKKAVEWDVIDRVPCVIRLVRAPKPSMGFYDFDEYERLLDAAKVLGPTAQLVVLLGGEAGLRCGEMIGLEWSDVDLAKRQMCIQRAEWRGHVTAPKGGRLRYVPMTARLAAAVRGYRHLKSHRVLSLDDGSTLTQDHVGEFVRKAGRGAGVAASGAHRLRHTFCSHLAMRGAPATAIQELAGHQDLSTTQRYMHLSPSAVENAIRLSETATPQAASHATWRHAGDEGAANQ